MVVLRSFVNRVTSLLSFEGLVASVGMSIRRRVYCTDRVYKCFMIDLFVDDEDSMQGG